MNKEKNPGPWKGREKIGEITQFRENKKEFYFPVIENHIILFKIFIKLQCVLIKSTIIRKHKKGEAKEI